MDQTAPESKAGPRGKADRIRDQLLASDLEMTSAWAEALVRAVDAHRLPSRDEVILEKLRGDLYARTQACLKQVGDLTIVVEESDLAFAGRAIYHAATDQGSVPAALYEAGVQQLTLRKGVEPGELRELVHVLRSASDESEESSDDAATLLWDQSFEHIDYTCARLEELERRAPSDSTAGRRSRR